jgi:Lamin Tail Domain
LFENDLVEAQKDPRYESFCEVIAARGFFSYCNEGSLEQLHRCSRVLSKFRAAYAPSDLGAHSGDQNKILKTAAPEERLSSTSLAATEKATTAVEKAAVKKAAADKKAAEAKAIADKKTAALKLQADKEETEDKKAAEAKAIADKKAFEDKKAAEAKAAESKLIADNKKAVVARLIADDKKAAEATAIADKKAAEATAIADKKAAEAKAIADKKAAEAEKTATEKAIVEKSTSNAVVPSIILSKPSNTPATESEKLADDETVGEKRRRSREKKSLVDLPFDRAKSSPEQSGRIPKSTETEAITVETTRSNKRKSIDSGEKESEEVSPASKSSKVVCNSNPFIEDIDLKQELIVVRNPSSTALDISGWKLSDDEGKNTFTIPAGTILKSNALLNVYCCAKGKDVKCLSKPFIFWTNKNGNPRMKNVLNDGGDKISLSDTSDTLIASCGKLPGEPAVVTHFIRGKKHCSSQTRDSYPPVEYTDHSLRSHDPASFRFSS